MTPPSQPVTRFVLEFRSTLMWRLIVISVVALADVGMAYSRSGRFGTAMLPWYAGYGIVVGALWIANRLVGKQLAHWLFPLGLCLDLIAVAVLQHRGNGAFWHGPIFYALTVLVASAVLSPRGVVLVTAAAIAVFAIKTHLEITGSWAFVRPGPPTLAFYGTRGYATDHFIFGTVALIAVAAIQRKLVLRIKRAESEHRAIVEASPDLIMTFDRSGIVRSANAAAVTSLGSAVTPGAPFDVLRLSVQSHDEARRAFLSARHGVAATVHSALTLEGQRTRQFSITFAPVLDGGDVRAVLASARDVTDERDAVAEREELQRQLEESRRMQLVGRLVSGVAHELNNPLSAILNHAELLRDGNAPARPEVDDGLDIIRGEARRAREIVRDLLQVARADSRRLRSSVSLERLANDVVAALRPLAELHEVTLTCDADPHLPSIVLDATGISQVLTNLVMNAIDACGAHGTISVRVTAEAESARIMVEDDGPGIAPEVRTHLFEPFVTTKGPGSGTGLGLAVSLGIVEQHDGRLFVEDVYPDRARRGARFVVLLPTDATPTDPQTMIPLFPDVSQNAAVDGIPGGPTATAATINSAITDTTHAQAVDAVHGSSVVTPTSQGTEAPARRRVLIVEDEPAIRAGLQRWFTRNGWIVKTVADGIDALDALKAFEHERVEIDAIICDLRMPRMGGPEFFARLERIAPALTQRIIFSTGDVVSEEVRSFITSVDVPVLEKPFEFRALEAQLIKVVEAQYG